MAENIRIVPKDEPMEVPSSPTIDIVPNKGAEKQLPENVPSLPQNGLKENDTKQLPENVLSLLQIGLNKTDTKQLPENVLSLLQIGLNENETKQLPENSLSLLQTGLNENDTKQLPEYSPSLLQIGLNENGTKQLPENVLSLLQIGPNEKDTKQLPENVPLLPAVETAPKKIYKQLPKIVPKGESTEMEVVASESHAVEEHHEPIRQEDIRCCPNTFGEVLATLCCGLQLFCLCCFIWCRKMIGK